MGEVNFSWALDRLKQGLKMSREGWNGKDMWIQIVTDWVRKDLKKSSGEDLYTGMDELPFIVMKTVQNQLVPWLASQTDLLADDWFIVE